MTLEQLEKIQNAGLMADDGSIHTGTVWADTNAGFQLARQDGKFYARYGGKIERVQGEVTQEQLDKYGVVIA